MFCGIDEAGRGSVMGPLVVGIVFVESDEKLRIMGAKDSKKLTPRARERLYYEITSSVDHWCTVSISSEEIDEQRKRISLNEIELNMFAEGASKWEASEVYADCPDTNEASFGNRLSALLGNNATVIAKHKSDENEIVVSAASIIAKVTRDWAMEEIRKEFGIDVGSGYPSDHYTMDFIRDWVSKNRRAPPHVRTSWEPVRDMLSIVSNTRLDDW